MKEFISEQLLKDYNNNNDSNIFDYPLMSSKENLSKNSVDSYKTIYSSKPEIKQPNIREIIFSDKKDFHIELFKSKKFAICYNETIKTYFFELNTFSEFTNPKIIEKEQRVNVYILEKNKENDIFQYENKEILEHLNIPLNKIKIIENFIKDINSFLEEESYIQLKNSNIKYKKKYIIYFLILLIIIVAISIIMFLYFYYNYNILPKQYIIGSYIIFIIIVLIFLINIIYKIINMNIKLMFNQIHYMINKENEIKIIINKWNQKEFESIRIKVSVPISLNYIIFNLDPFQNIIIEDLDISNIISIFYPNLTISSSEIIEFENKKK